MPRFQGIPVDPQEKTSRFNGIPVEAPMPAQPEPDFANEIKRQLGLTVRAGVEGGLALPAIIADALGSMISIIPGVDIPSTTESISKLLTEAGVPQPETTQEKIVGGAAKTLAGAGGSVGVGQLLTKAAPSVAKALSFAPTSQAVSAATGGGASRVAESQGVGELGQTVAGFGASLVAPTSLSFGSKLKSLLRPTAQNKLKEAAKAAGPKFIDRLAELGDKAVLADTSPAFKGLAQGVVGRSPATREISESALTLRVKGLSKRLTDKVSEIMGKDGDIYQDTAALLASRAKTAQPLYKHAFSQPITTDPKKVAGVKAALNTLLKTDAVKRAIPKARRLASNEGRKFDDSNLEDAGVQIWDDIKQGLDDVIESNKNEFGKLNKVGASVVGVKKRLLKILDNNTDYKKARETFSSDSEMLDSLKFGGDVLGSKITPSQVRAEFNAMNSAEKEAALSGLAGAIKNQIGRVKEDTASAANFIASPNNKEKIAAMIGKDGFNNLRKFVETEVTFRKTMSELVGGSQTQLRRAAEQAVNKQVNVEVPTKTGAANIIARGFGKLTGLSDDEALKLTKMTSTPQSKVEVISILKSKKLTGDEIKSILPVLAQVEATKDDDRALSKQDISIDDLVTKYAKP